MPTPNLLSGLNTAQIEAVLHKNGPLLVAAGAGSGKTKVLTHRIARLIADGTSPEKILAVTFTNKAAGEMKERVAKLLPVPSPRSPFLIPWMGTFHSLGAWILRREAGEVGMRKNFSIIDDEDSLALVKESIKELGLDPKQFPPFGIKKTISARKCDMLKPEDLAEESADYFSKKLVSVWELYEQKLKSSNSADFDDLLVKTALLFSSKPEVLQKYQDLWDHILIDEYQDTDHVQHALATMLAAGHKNICVVGDIDQSIYSFRGADFRNILGFGALYPEAKAVTLEENYRSTQPILSASNAVIEKNELRRPKNLFTKIEGGEKLGVFAAENENEEADFIASVAGGLIESGVKPEEIAVLFRTNAQSRVLEEKFLARNIPHHVVGVKFYSRKEVKDILAYIKSALNPEDFLSKKRIVNQPARGIGKVMTAKYFSGIKLSGSEAERISSFEKILEKIRGFSGAAPASKLVSFVIKESGYLDLFDVSSEEGTMRIANIKELASLASKFDALNPPEGIVKMLEESALMSEQDSLGGKGNGVPLTTVHAAKGLEFDHVFISGLEDGLFPHTSFGGENEKLRLEEERRLFYVALTRARRKIFLTLSFFRNIFGEKQVNMPSRFLSDIPPELLEKAGEEKVIEI